MSKLYLLCYVCKRMTVVDVYSMNVCEQIASS